jgi:hypothetical protein
VNDKEDRLEDLVDLEDIKKGNKKLLEKERFSKKKRIAGI